MDTASHYVMMEDFVVTGFQLGTARNTSFNILPYSLKDINAKAPYNLSDALAKLPGISQMTTGNSISKPVIRGLYGNRILVLYTGMRFDNQQWQDEHGLGLSQIGIDRVEVIKGPASLLYGSDALGGVINIIEEKPIEKGSYSSAGMQLFTNTLGILADAGVSNRKGKNWWRVRLGGENHADYTDGNGVRIFNSRNKGYYLKAGYGFERRKWEQENSYNFSYNQYGFIMDSMGTFFVPDERWARQMSGPHHNVMLNMFSSQNTFKLQQSTLKVNAGFQSNMRAEDEGGGQISLKMHLLSVLQSMKWEKELSKKVTFVLNQQYTYEHNTNYGFRIIIPDASFMEGNLSGYVKLVSGKLIAEVGAGVSDKYIKTIKTKSLNPPGSEVAPFTKNDVTGNGMLGAVYNANDWFSIKANASTGFRSPNLAELSSNGVHEGTYRYEIGDPNLAIEKNINADLILNISRKQWSFSVSGYYQRFLDYVYLAPDTVKYFGFQVYRYRQQDAAIYGTECMLNIMPAALKGFSLKETFAATEGKTDTAGYLPFIPAYKLNSAMRFEKSLRKKISSVFIEPEYVYVFRQDRPAQFETATANYYLLNVTSGVNINTPKGKWTIGLTGTNLTNTAYVDHLSRLKYYGLLNQGINFVFFLRKEFK